MNYSLRWGLIKAEFTKGSKVWLARPKTKTVGNAHPTGLILIAAILAAVI
ncbi:MAG: hypothetical protein AB1711_07230 [Thermodesulfobacteriota bacterium]